MDNILTIVLAVSLSTATSSIVSYRACRRHLDAIDKFTADVTEMVKDLISHVIMLIKPQGGERGE